jgi:hypothetical protein
VKPSTFTIVFSMVPRVAPSLKTLAASVENTREGPCGTLKVGPRRENSL